MIPAVSKGVVKSGWDGRGEKIFVHDTVCGRTDHRMKVHLLIISLLHREKLLLQRENSHCTGSAARIETKKIVAGIPSIQNFLSTTIGCDPALTFTTIFCMWPHQFLPPRLFLLYQDGENGGQLRTKRNVTLITISFAPASSGRRFPGGAAAPRHRRCRLKHVFNNFATHWNPMHTRRKHHLVINHLTSD